MCPSLWRSGTKSASSGCQASGPSAISRSGTKETDSCPRTSRTRPTAAGSSRGARSAGRSRGSHSLHVRSRPSSASRPSSRAVDGLDAEVVPGRAVERDDDGAVAHRLGDGGGDRGQQRVEVLLAAHEPRDLEQTGEPRDRVRAVLGRSHHPLIGHHLSRLKRRWTRLERPLALSAMAEQRARPEGIAGSPHAGPVPGGRVRRQAARRAAQARARAALRRGLRPARRPRARLVRAARRRGRRALRDVARRLRGAAACRRARWPTAPRSSSPAAPTTTRARARRRRRSPSRSAACASPARATCSPSSRCCAGRWRPRGCSSPRSACARPALPRCIGVVTGEGGKARDDVLAGLRRRGWAGRRRLGLRARPGSPRRARHHPRAAGPGRRAGGRGHRRRARRRLAGRPLRLLRRDPVPDRRAAARAGHRLGRPPHRPHADRRRRRRELLDADPRRRDRRAAALRRGARGAAARRRAPGRPRAPRRARPRAPPGAPLARAGRARRARAPRACIRRCARSARAPRGACATSARRRARRALALARRAAAAAGPELAARRTRARRLHPRARRPRPRARGRARLRGGRRPRRATS